jgi:hypothetical protein
VVSSKRAIAYSLLDLVGTIWPIRVRVDRAYVWLWVNLDVL